MRITLNTWQAASRILRRMGAEAALGAMCGAAYGAFFGGLWVLAESDRSSKAMLIGASVALSGTVVLGFLGALRANRRNPVGDCGRSFE